MQKQQTLPESWLHHKRVRVRAGAERRAAAQRGRAGRHGLAPHLGCAQAAGAQQHTLRAPAPARPPPPPRARLHAAGHSIDKGPAKREALPDLRAPHWRTLEQEGALQPVTLPGTTW